MRLLLIMPAGHRTRLWWSIVRSDSPDLAEAIMRRPLTTLALLASATAAAPTPAASQPLAITDVNVVDAGEGVVRPGLTVVVSGDRIIALGPSGSIEVPGDARVLDGTGRFLIPGLWDMHVHTGSDENTRGIMYPLLLAHGVTGMRNMMGDCFDCGPVDFAIDQVNARRRAVAAGELMGPRVVASSAFAGSHEQAARRSAEGSSPQAPATEVDARAFVRLAKARGADFIKIYDMLPREAYFALVEEANEVGLPFAGHVPVEVRASEASDAGQRSIEHLGMGNVLEECSSREADLRARVIAELEKAEMGSRHTADGPALLPLVLEMVDSYDPARCAALAERFVRNGTWVVPTLMTSRLPSELGTGWREDPYARFLPPDERRFFEMAEDAYTSDLGDAADQAPVSRWAREVTRTMHRAGVRMLAGSDAGYTGIFWGIGLHRELELLVSAGFTEAAALRAATLGPAEFLGATDSLGSVAVGKLADLVLLEANPLDDIADTQQIAAVVLRGRYLDREALDALLTGAERAAQSRDPASAVAIEGDNNRVELQSADDAVRDLGTSNAATRPPGVPRKSDAPVGQAPQAATAQEWNDSSSHEIRFVTVAPDVRLEVLDWGGHGLPLVFLAGANFNAHSFDDFAPRFTDTHRVLGITRRGHGNSTWPDAGYDLPTLVEDIRVVLDSLGIDRAILAGHSMAGSEMTLLATESPDRVAGLIYIDAGHDPTDIGRLRVPELCAASFGPGFLEAMQRTFENPELVRRTQWYTDESGARRPFASAAAGASIDLPTPDYSGVRVPALGIYYVPKRTEDVFMGLGEPVGACVAAFHRYIHGGIAAFVEGVEQATFSPLSDTNHNIHLASPAALEAVMRRWLDSHSTPDPTDRLVREHMEALGIPAVSLVVMRNGVVLREAAYGRPSLELDVTATPATVFPYASMAKVFTGTAVLRLVQDGRLSLEGRIVDLLPDLPPAWSDVTVRQLLGHTSGLPDLNAERGFQNPFVSPWAGRAAALDALAGLPVERAPGTGFSYNQTNYLLLGMLLERIDGRTVEEYVAEEIAGPLGLASLAYGDSRVAIAGRASWYSRVDFSGGEPRVVAPRPLWIEYSPFLHTAAGLNGTARDLAGFVDAVASGHLLDDAHRHEMWTAVPLADGSTLRFEDGVTGAGLGWWVHDDPTHPWVGMGGGASGVVRHHVNEGLTIAVLTNLQGAEPEALASAIAEIYLRVDTTQAPPPIGESAADRASILAAPREVRPGETVQNPGPGTRPSSGVRWDHEAAESPGEASQAALIDWYDP